MSQKTLSLIGAGPVGCLMAIHLAKRGYNVEIFERRADLRFAEVAAGRSINLALSLRGISALQELGIDNEILSQAVPMYGRMMHALTGELTFQRYGRDDTQYINSISRGELNRALLSYAEKFPNIQINFQKKLEAYNHSSQMLTFFNELNQETLQHAAGCVIGCDGSASKLRDGMQAQANFSVQEAPLDYGYKELTIPAGNNGNYLIEKNALHIWPRGTHMLIALPNFDGSFTCTLFLPWKGELSFEKLTTQEAVENFFEEYYPDAKKIVKNLSESFFVNPTGHMVTVHTSPWFSKSNVLLIGDAAHAIVPFFGQGLNSGFEDCSIFNRHLSQSSDLGEVFKNFYQERKEDADAIATLALDNFVEMRDKVAQPRFLLEKNIEKILSQKFPTDYVSRYSLVTFSRTPYRVALRAGRIQDEILAELSKNISKAEEVDLKLAAELIKTRLLPALEMNLQESQI